MFHTTQLAAAVSSVTILAATATGQTVTVFEEDFENPNGISLINGLDVTQQTVTQLYGVPFQQTFTVETLAINGPANTYTDPSGVAGDYAIGMLSSGQNDLFSITFDSRSRRFVNVFFDLSSIDIPGLGGPFTVDNASVPVMRVEVLDTPGGLFNIGAAGSFASLGLDDAVGVASPRFEFDWTSHVLSFDTAGSTDGIVTILFDLTAGGYAGLDNIAVRANNIPGPGSAAFVALAGLGGLRRRR